MDLEAATTPGYAMGRGSDDARDHAGDELREELKRRRMCSRKRAYESRAEAKFYARCNGKRAYCCPYCQQWHLTSQNVERTDAVSAR